MTDGLGGGDDKESYVIEESPPPPGVDIVTKEKGCERVANHS